MFVNLLDIVYPIGSLYCSSKSTSPSSFLGGSWTQINDTVLRGANSYEYGGNDNVTLTTNQIPSHSHVVWFGSAANSGSIAGAGYFTEGGGNNNFKSQFTIRSTAEGGGKPLLACLATSTCICGCVPLKCAQRSKWGDI